MNNSLMFVDGREEKEFVNPFPNVRMLVKNGECMWCLKDFAIAIGYTQVNGVLRLLTPLEKEAITSEVTACIRTNGRVDHKPMKYAKIDILNSVINRTALKTEAVKVWKSKMQEVGGEAVKSQLGIENDMMQIVENESITGYPIVKTAEKTIDFEKMEQLRDVFGTEVPFKLVGNKPYWGARAVLNILGFTNARDIIKSSSTGILKIPVEHEENGVVKRRELNFISIEDINKIILNSRKSNPMIDKWKETNRMISGEAVKSQLGIENDIDKMVNERVEKALSVQNSTNSLIQVLIEQNKHSDMLIANMQEDNRKFQLQLLDRLVPKSDNLKCTKYITDFVGGNKNMAAQVNVELEKAGYLKRVVEGNDKHWEFTDIAKRLNIGEIVNERHYKTILYNEKATDIIEDMIGKVKENNSLLF